LALPVKFKLHLRQADVVSAFLNSNIDADIFMTQPKGFEDEKLSKYFCLLQKELDEPKQGHIWNKRLDRFGLEEAGKLSGSLVTK
jgi:hypothetical protein